MSLDYRPMLLSHQLFRETVPLTFPPKIKLKFKRQFLSKRFPVGKVGTKLIKVLNHDPYTGDWEKSDPDRQRWRYR
jgi:hypothetical protein